MDKKQISLLFIRGIAEVANAKSPTTFAFLCKSCDNAEHIGEVTERSKVLAWKASEGLRPPQVRILSSPQF